MKLCLGMLVKNEAVFLKDTLPNIIHLFDGAVALAEESQEDETNGVLKDFGFDIILKADTVTDFGEARNEIIARAESLGFDACFMLDGDESIFPDTVENIRLALEHNRVLTLPRYNVGPTINLFNPQLYPDHQQRAFLLNTGVKYIGKIHESINAEVVTIEDHIYHYALLKDPREKWFQYHNVSLMMKNKKLLTSIPKWVSKEHIGEYREFLLPHPLSDSKSNYSKLYHRVDSD